MSKKAARLKKQLQELKDPGWRTSARALDQFREWLEQKVKESPSATGKITSPPLACDWQDEDTHFKLHACLRRMIKEGYDLYEYFPRVLDKWVDVMWMLQVKAAEDTRSSIFELFVIYEHRKLIDSWFETGEEDFHGRHPKEETVRLRKSKRELAASLGPKTRKKDEERCPQENYRQDRTARLSKNRFTVIDGGKND
jgi:hypothetical protein